MVAHQTPTSLVASVAGTPSVINPLQAARGGEALAPDVTSALDRLSREMLRVLEMIERADCQNASATRGAVNEGR